MDKVSDKSLSKLEKKRVKLEAKIAKREAKLNKKSAKKKVLNAHSTLPGIQLQMYARYDGNESMSHSMQELVKNREKERKLQKKKLEEMRFRVDMHKEALRSRMEKPTKESSPDCTNQHVKLTDIENSDEKSKGNDCIICFGRPINTVIYHCGHMLCCDTCAKDLKRQGSECPICRGSIADIIKVYIV